MPLIQSVLIKHGGQIELDNISNFLNIVTPSAADTLIIEVGDSNSIGIEVVHNLIRWSSNKPHSSTFKLATIMRAEMLTPQAQNGLLKVLEEPSPDTLICLVTSRPNHLLPTVRSRLRQINVSAEQEATDLSQARAFLDSNLIERSKIIDSMVAKDNRNQIQDLIETMIKELIRKITIETESKDKYLKTIDICKLAYQGIRSGANIRLTLEAISLNC